METYKESKTRLKELRGKERRREFRGVPLMIVGVVLLLVSMKVDFPARYAWCDMASWYIGWTAAIFGWVRKMLA